MALAICQNSTLQSTTTFCLRGTGSMPKAWCSIWGQAQNVFCPKPKKALGAFCRQRHKPKQGPLLTEIYQMNRTTHSPYAPLEMQYPQQTNANGSTPPTTSSNFDHCFTLHRNTKPEAYLTPKHYYRVNPRYNSNLAPYSAVTTGNLLHKSGKEWWSSYKCPIQKKYCCFLH